MARRPLELTFLDDCPACEGEGLVVVELVGQAGFQDILVLCDNCVERPVEDIGDDCAPATDEQYLYCPECGDASLTSGITCALGHGGEGVTWTEWVKIRDAKET